MTMPNRFSLVGGVADSDNEDAMFRARALKKNICLCLTRNDDNFWTRFNLKNKKSQMSRRLKLISHRAAPKPKTTMSTDRYNRSIIYPCITIYERARQLSAIFIGCH